MNKKMGNTQKGITQQSHLNNSPTHVALIAAVRSQLMREPYFRYHTLSQLIKHFKSAGYTPRQVQKAVDALVLNREVKLEKRYLLMQSEVAVIPVGGR